MHNTLASLAVLALLSTPVAAEVGIYGQCRGIDELGFAQDLCGPVVEGRWKWLHGEASHERTAKNSFTGIPDKTYITQLAIGADRTVGPVRVGAGYQWFRQHLDSVNEDGESPYVMLGYDGYRWDTTARYTLGTHLLDFLRVVTHWHAWRNVSMRYELGWVEFDCCGEKNRGAWWLGVGVGFVWNHGAKMERGR